MWAVIGVLGCSSGSPGPSGVGMSAPAGGGAEAGSAELPRLSPPGPFKLIPGDLLRIVVFRHKDLDLEVRIPENGEFSYPLIGAVKAAGRSPAEVQAEIKARLEERFVRRAEVLATVVDYAPRSVYVLGAVAQPSAYPLRPGQRLTVLKLVAAAGGLTDRALKERVQLVRRKEGGGHESVRFSLAELERRVAAGAVEADPELAPDDLVVIPSAARVAYVLGQVNRPGALELPPNTRVTVSMAVSQAGSWTKFAAIGRVQVLRQRPEGGSAARAVDLEAVVNGAVEQDLELEPGDVVWVPERGIF